MLVSRASILHSAHFVSLNLLLSSWQFGLALCRVRWETSPVLALCCLISQDMAAAEPCWWASHLIGNTHSLSVGHHSFGWFWNYQLNCWRKPCFILERKSGEELHPAFTSLHCNVNTLSKCLVLDLGVATDTCLCVCEDSRGCGRAMCWLRKAICCCSFLVISVQSSWVVKVIV